MSSLQQRVIEARGSSAATNKKASFENCFSAGLDLSEFAAPSPQTQSASSELIRIKNQELKEEADLVKRIAEVHAKKSNQATPTYELSLRAENPHSAHTTGSERNNNFLQFDNESNRVDDGFISSLVQGHNSEKKEFGRSHRSLKSKAARANSSKMNAAVRGMNKKSSRVQPSGSNKKISAKKASRSKF